jgi:hypothetical protein
VFLKLLLIFRNRAKFCDVKVAAFIIVGVITLGYVVVELGAGIMLQSLVLLSDGFHNLSDVISLYIAYWAQQVPFNSYSCPSFLVHQLIYFVGSKARSKRRNVVWVGSIRNTWRPY